MLGCERLACWPAHATDILMKHRLGVIVVAALLVASCQPGTRPAVQFP